MLYGARRGLPLTARQIGSDMGVEHRRHQRFSYSNGAVVTYDGKSCECTVLDISASGAAFKSAWKPNAGATVETPNSRADNPTRASAAPARVKTAASRFEAQRARPRATRGRLRGPSPDVAGPRYGRRPRVGGSPAPGARRPAIGRPCCSALRRSSSCGRRSSRRRWTRRA